MGFANPTASVSVTYLKGGGAKNLRVKVESMTLKERKVFYLKRDVDNKEQELGE